MLLDWRLPVLDGLEVVRRLRRDGSYVPVIAITAHAHPGAREECLSAGCSEFLSKPVDAAELRRLIGRYLGELESEPVVEEEKDDFRADLRARYVRSLVSELTALSVALHAEDYEAVRVLAHRIKGGAATFGLEAISRLARDLEHIDVEAEGFKAQASNVMVKLRSMARELEGDST